MPDIRVIAEVENVVRDRLKKTQPEIEASLAHIAEGNPLAAETTPRRRIDRLQTKAGLNHEEATMISAAIDLAAGQKPLTTAAAKPPGPEAIRGATFDFVGVAFLERGRRTADAVGRVAFLNGAPQGTGFLVAPNLFLTNHHVIESAAAASRLQVQFDYEYDLQDRARDYTAFFFDPEICFVTDDIHGLDYTLIGIAQRRSGNRDLEEFAFIPLSDADDKHMLGELANVIQHPDGRFKEVVLRENHLVARDETLQVLHYVADTEQGSSGSPVFNNEWEPIALHHWGGPWHEVMNTKGRPLASEINEGIRISAIVRSLRDRKLNGASAAAVQRALDIWDRTGRRLHYTLSAPAREEELIQGQSAQAPAKTGLGASTRHNSDGSVTWTFPIEVTVRAPLAAMAGRGTGPRPPGLPYAEAASWKTENFDDRDGYDPEFIPGFVVPLPSQDALPFRLAKNQLAADNDDPHELRYHHFSIVMNAERRLACVTAVNIDGARIKAVIRKDKKVIDEPSLRELGVESIGAEGAEASDDFRPDRRILLDEQMSKAFYERQKVSGFPKPTSPARIARIFQKGHIVLRGDPAWGTDDEALSAERDTFFYTNAAPQVGFFNQGSDLNRPGTKGKLRWRAVETYVLRNALTMGSRVSVFTGPVFTDDDPPYRFESKVPMRFWKIAIWSDGESLRSIALLADQRAVLKVMPEALGPEAFGDEEELARVSEHLSTVEEIEALTGLDFGKEVRDGDILADMESAHAPALTFEPEQLNRPLPKTARRRRKPPRRKKSAPRR
jgi:endonuclease G